jgi:dihydrofolate synthase/folylpolyglutamate synthase
LVEIDRDCSFHAVGERKGHFTFDLKTPRNTYRRLRLSLAGKHQMRNAALAIAAAEILPRLSPGTSAVQTGIANTRWPGRLDEYSCRRKTLLDGAHNAEGAQLLAEHLQRHWPRRIHMVFGAMKDKDIRKMGRALFPLAESIHMAPLGNARSASPEAIAAMHSRFRARMQTHRNAVDALRGAWQDCPRNGLVVVTGSLYLIGEVLPLVRRQL